MNAIDAAALAALREDGGGPDGALDDDARDVLRDAAAAEVRQDPVGRISRSIRSLRGTGDGGGSPVSGAGGSLEERIRQVRARAIGARGDVAPAAVIAILDRSSGTSATPGTAHLSPRQQALADEVHDGVGDARRIIASLVPPPDRPVEPDEVEAIRGGVRYSLDVLAREATRRGPRQSVVDSRLRLLWREQETAGDLATLIAIFDPGDGFPSTADEQQKVRLELLRNHVRRVERAFVGYFAAAPGEVDREALAAQMRVVGDTVDAVRAALRAAGLSVAEASAPSSRLRVLGRGLPDLAFEQFLDWIAETTGDDAIAQLSASGSFAATALRIEAQELVGYLDRVAIPVDVDDQSSELGEVLRDEDVASELRSLRSQLMSLVALVPDEGNG